MLDVRIIELISLVASNSLAVFCLCNLIIAILLVGMSKTISEFDEEKPHAFPKDDDIKKYRVSSGEKAKNFIDRDEEQKVSSVTVDMISNEAESPDEEDDELRRRVEDFIEKINRSWRAEKLNAYSLGQY